MWAPTLKVGQKTSLPGRIDLLDCEALKVSHERCKDANKIRARH